MGRTSTPKYIAHFMGYINRTETLFAWKGRIPTVQQLESIVLEHVVSTFDGYANEAVGKTFCVQIPSRAVVKENKLGGKVLVEWKSPMFMTLPNPANFPRVQKIAK